MQRGHKVKFNRKWCILMHTGYLDVWANEKEPGGTHCHQGKTNTSQKASNLIDKAVTCTILWFKKSYLSSLLVEGANAK